MTWRRSKIRTIERRRRTKVKLSFAIKCYKRMQKAFNLCKNCNIQAIVVLKVIQHQIGPLVGLIKTQKITQILFSPFFLSTKEMQECFLHRAV